jgi:hypothetical protein
VFGVQHPITPLLQFPVGWQTPLLFNALTFLTF